MGVEGREGILHPDIYPAQHQPTGNKLDELPENRSELGKEGVCVEVSSGECV